MINKVIHYCWFGTKPLPKLAQRCIKSWEKHLPDFEIKRWDESNFDVNIIPYTGQAARAKKWAFVSDYARFHILHEEGGIYLDCDVEVLKKFDVELLSNDMFTGFEDDQYVAPGLILGSVKNTALFSEILTLYANRQFRIEGGYDETTVVTFFTDFLSRKGLVANNQRQLIEGITIFPTDYFSPLNTLDGKFYCTSDTYTIHHYAGSWISSSTKLKMVLVKMSMKYKSLRILKNCYDRFF